MVLDLRDVTIRRGGTTILDSVSWTVADGQRWVVLGPNGAGKTTLLQIASGRMHPTSGTATVLGSRLGAVDVFDLRPRVGVASAALADRIPPTESVLDVVLTAAYGTTGRWREAYEALDHERAHALLDVFGVGELADRTFGTLREGERKRTQIARALMTDPELLLLDEPAAGLDLGGREELLQALTELANDLRSPVMVLVTHHVEEIPVVFTHALLLRAGRVDAPGPEQQGVREADRDLLDVVGDQHHHRRPEVVGQLRQGLQKLLPPAEVQARGGFVEQQQLRVGHQRAGDLGPLALALAERPERPVGQLADAEDVQQGVCTLVIERLVRLTPATGRPVRGGEHDVEHALGRRDPVGEGCRRNTHPWTQVEDVDRTQPGSQHRRGARGRVHPPGSDLQQRRLACAVGAEDHPPLPVGHGPRHRVEDGRAAAPDGHAPQIQHHAPTLTRRTVHPPSKARTRPRLRLPD